MVLATSSASLREVSGLTLLASGKVRELYELGDDLLMVASDRISTYDVVHPTPIPDKGKVLTGLSVLWFDLTKDIVPNHLVSVTEGVPDEFRGRGMRVKRLQMLPGVTGVALGGQIPFARAGGGVGDCWGFHAAGRMQAKPADDPCVEHYSVTPEYFRVLGIPVLSGTVFGDDDTATSRRVVVVSASTAAHVWGGADPIGAQVRLGSSLPADGRRPVEDDGQRLYAARFL